MSHPSNIHGEAEGRARIAQLNSDALMRLCAEHNITLRTATAHLWRPTLRVRGDIPGVAEGLTILCTDGICAWFVNDLGTLLFGHVQRFDGEVKTLHGLAKPAKAKDHEGEARAKSRRTKSTRTLKASATAQAVELLEQMLKSLKS